MLTKTPIVILGGIITFDASLDGIDGQLILDTGSVNSTLNVKYFENHPNSKVQKIEMPVIYGNTTGTRIAKTGTTVIEEVSFDNCILQNFTAKLLDLDYVENPLVKYKADLKVLGTIGMDVIKNYVVKIDYPQKNISWSDDENQMSSVTSGKKHNFEVSGANYILLDVKAENKTFKFIFDTGASTCVVDKNLRDVLTKEVVDEKHFVAKDLFVCDIPFENMPFTTIDMTRLSEKRKNSRHNRLPVCEKFCYHVKLSQKGNHFRVIKFKNTTWEIA